jgi:hypothetical protein
MADKNYKITFELSDGSEKSVEFTAPQGEPGKNGKDGYSPIKGVDYFDGEDGTDGKSAYEYAKESGYAGTEQEFAQKMAREMPAKTSDLTNDCGFIKASEAPVQSVNGQTGDVRLSAEDVGARPSTWTPSYSDVGADKSGAASSAVSSHNTNTSAHNDIRLLIEGLTTRLNALANSTDEDLDQMAEIVAYIKANKELIDGVTTSKVSVADIVNDLITNVTNKPLSAAQGVALKALIDAITVPTKLSDLTGDATHRTVTDAEKSAWNAKLGQSNLQAATDAALAQAKESGEFDGSPGTSVTVKSVSESTADGGNNAVTFSDGKVLNVKNGSKGSVGKTAYQYAKDGGYTGTEAEFAEDVNPDNIVNTITENTKDYITEDLKNDIVQSIIAELQGLPVFGVVDENNTITVTSQLSDGTYTLMYENADGTLEAIGTITVGNGDVVEYTNLVDTTLTTDTTITLSSQGWLENVRINSSNAIVTADGNHITNIIHVGNKNVLRIKNMDIYGGYGRIYLYAGTTFVYSIKPADNSVIFTSIGDEYSEVTIAKLQEQLSANVHGGTFDSVRIGGTLIGTKEDVIVTLDEEIT